MNTRKYYSVHIVGGAVIGSEERRTIYSVLCCVAIDSVVFNFIKINKSHVFGGFPFPIVRLSLEIPVL